MKESELHRLFSTYPDGSWGLALLLLRLAIGSIAVFQGNLYLTPGHHQNALPWLLSISAMAIGVSMLIGFMTALSGVLIAVLTMATGLSWVPLPPANLFEPRTFTLLVIVVAGAIALLGPGALSIDARLFGRREIIIPHIPRSPGS